MSIFKTKFVRTVLSVALCVVLLCTTAFANTTYKFSELPGDVNGDGEKNLKDLITLARLAADWDVEYNPLAADINGDGIVDLEDVTTLARNLAGYNEEGIDKEPVITLPEPVTYAPTAKKNYNKNLVGGEFKFTLEGEIDGTVISQEKTNSANGDITFDALSFPKVGTYTFTVKEINEYLGFVEYSTAEHTLVVNVIYEDGVLSIESVTVNGDENGTIEFTNTYSIDGEDEVTLRGNTVLTGDRTETQENEFEFGLYNEENTLVESVMNDAAGNFAFTTLKFDENDTEIDSEKQFTYTIKEIAGNNARYTYDETVHTVVVTVADNDEGGVTASYTVNGVANSEIKFTNNYSNPAPVTYAPTANKIYNKNLAGGEFKFILEGKIDGAVISQEKTNSADGTIAFDTLSFPEAGTYTFTVKEIDKILSFIDYSTAEHTLVVNVIDTNGVLSIESVTVNGDADGTIVFENIYSFDANALITIKGNTVLTGDRIEAQENEFEFGLYNADGTLVKTVKNDVNGNFEFTVNYNANDIAIDGETQFTYTIKEIKGEDVCVTYDENVYTVVVTLKDNDEGGVTASYTVNGEANGEIKFTNYTKPESVEKFVVKFPETESFVYRLGNKNSVTLGNLFKVAEGIETAEIAGVTVEVTNSEGEKLNVYTEGATWDAGTLKFAGFTGLATITINMPADDCCLTTTLTVEVIDATNLTSATGTTTGGTFVLLNDINTTTYVNYWNCTVYGNGFTYSLNGAPTTYNSKQGHGIIITKNTTLDNIVFIGDIYEGYGAYSTNDYYNSVIDAIGDTTIQNCYIANCSAPVRARSNINITNSTLYGGAVANLVIMSGNVTLNDVTTANYDDGRNYVGMGIVIHKDATDGSKLTLNGTLKQYNFLSESKVPTVTEAKNLHTAMFSNVCNKYHFGTSPNRYVNTGIISLTETFTADDLEDNAKTGYEGLELTVSSYDGYVYTQPNTSGSVNNNCPKYEPTTQGAVPPSYNFDYTNKNYVGKVDGSNDYCYYENGKVNISMDDGDTFNWDTSILTIGKGIEKYTVSMNGVDYTGKNIAFNKEGNYEISYTYTDPKNYKLDTDGNITTYNVTYTKNVSITVAVAKATTKHAEFTMGNNQATEKITVGNKTYISANGVSHDNAKWSYITVDGTKIFYPIVEAEIVSKKTAYFYVFKDVITITDYENSGTGTAIKYDSSTTKMPTGLSVVKGHYNAFTKISSNWSTLTDGNLTLSGAENVFKYAASSTASSTPTTRNNALCFKSPDVTNKRDEYYTIVQYSYSDNAGNTYYYYVGYHMAAKADGGGCVTPDTLITLADGTQKRIDKVTYADKILVWDFYKGEYTVMPSSIVMNHGYNNYDVVTLNFSDGTSVNTINGHGFFDTGLNKFVILGTDNVADYVGHEFVKDAEKKITAKLVSYSIKNEDTESWSVLTSVHYNCFLEGMLTITPAEVDDSPEYLMPYEIGDNMKYIEAKMNADIEKYGLYTYEDFADYVTYEQFVALGLENFKVSVAKGYITWEEILYLISIHIG